MAGNAVIAHRRDATHGLDVTVTAVQLRMCAGQGKACLSTMIEQPRPPVRRVVTVIALVAEAATVRVIVEMTRHARTVRIVIGRRRVTLITCNPGVGADQRKACDVVVEPDARCPAAWHVADFTTIAKLADMHIVDGVTATTILGQRHGKILGVASVTREVTMTGRQLESGLFFVIEQHRIPVEYVVAAATIGAEAPFMRIVFAMAGTALAVADV